MSTSQARSAAQHSDAAARLEPEERILAQTEGSRSVNFVTESGLYNLIFRSDKPQAKVFRLWITVSLKGMAFDEIPLGYLDWLAGQEWLRPGPFKARLIAYLNNPCIQRELDQLFAEPDYGDPQVYQRRESMQQDPSKLPDRGPSHNKRIPESENTTRWTPQTAWEALADFAADADNAMASESYEVTQFLEAASQLKSALFYLQTASFVTHPKPDTLSKLRSKYRAWRSACRRSRRHSPESPYYTARQRVADYLSDARVFSVDAA